MTTVKQRAQSAWSWFRRWRQSRLERAQRRALAGRHGDPRTGDPGAIYGESGWHQGQGQG